MTWPKINYHKAFEIQLENWLPTTKQDWIKEQDLVLNTSQQLISNEKDLRKYCKQNVWKFPEQDVYFITDLHADADALYKSLIGAGLIDKYGVHDHEFSLTKKANDIKVIIGGDCFDKGPSNLRLLDSIKLLKQAGLKIILLAGNHDIRTFAGIKCSETKDLVEEHMFVRMGQKSIPLFKEIYFKYLHKKLNEDELLSDEEVRERLFPSQKWFDNYAKLMDGKIPPKKIAKETTRIKEKIAEVETYLKRIGLKLGHLYATVSKAQAIFLKKNGDYNWFFKEMKVIHQEGSFLFVHAGLDDFSADWLEQIGIKGVNQKFQQMMKEDVFNLYHGHVGNLFRTKYRDVDFPFTKRGAKQIRNLGIEAIVHGHCNTVSGQKLVIKKGILNIECDTSLDRKTRRIEQLPGVGASFLKISSKGKLIAKSNDANFIKKLDINEIGNKTKTSSKEILGKNQKDTQVELVNALSLKEVKSKTDIEALLKEIANEIGNEELQLSKENKLLTLPLSNNLQVSLKAKSKGKKQSIKIELDWVKT